jgi:hypothetical protein
MFFEREEDGTSNPQIHHCLELRRGRFFRVPDKAAVASLRAKPLVSQTSRHAALVRSSASQPFGRSAVMRRYQLLRAAATKGSSHVGEHQEVTL